ncbi:hypothetical protein E0Z10_g815 [Xylaria hypoxylon]|uniref:Uncharacterized protein n=1 Tax=Xylaria hypoxylon TaxID=37992 RepID=A0A4Z0Z8K0_9PEZI|nr:hypothetical protein E0Z10_g815 [Xylaria hypoxylon]
MSLIIYKENERKIEKANIEDNLLAAATFLYNTFNAVPSAIPARSTLDNVASDFRARQDTQARAARLLVILLALLDSDVEADRFLGDGDAFSAAFGDLAIISVGGGVIDIVVGVVPSSVGGSDERIEFVSSEAIF